MVISYGFSKLSELFYPNSCSFYSIQTRATGVINSQAFQHFLYALITYIIFVRKVTI